MQTKTESSRKCSLVILCLRYFGSINQCKKWRNNTCLNKPRLKLEWHWFNPW